MALGLASRSGTRPRDWDAGSIERLPALRDGTPSDMNGLLLGYYKEFFAAQCPNC